MIIQYGLNVNLGSKLFKNTLALAIIAMLLYLAVVFFVDIKDFSSNLVEINYLNIPIILIPMTIHILLLGIRFHRLIIQLNVKSTLKDSILIYLTGLAFGITPVGAGQIIKSHIIIKKFRWV